MTKKVLLVATSATEMNGHSTGLWLEELAAPYHVFQDAGVEPTIVSVKGGKVTLDKNSIPDGIPAEFQSVADMLEDTKALADVNVSDFAGVLFAGGHGPMVDFASNPVIAQLIHDTESHDGVVGAVCHGVGALVDVKKADGTYYVQGKNITGFTDEEEDMVKLTKYVPFLLESKLREQGAAFVAASAFADHVIVDGKLVTGQNPASSESTAKAMLELL